MIMSLLIINDHYSFTISIVLIVLIIVMIGIITTSLVALALAADEYKNDTESKKEIRILKKYGGITLLMLAVHIICEAHNFTSVP